MFKSVLFGLVIIVMSLGALTANAQVPTTYTLENIFSSVHDAPKSFWLDGSGGFAGYTLTGKYFQQQPVVSDVHVSLQRFSIDQAHFYISNFGLINAESDTVALSIYLSRAGFEDSVV